VQTATNFFSILQGPLVIADPDVNDSRVTLVGVVSWSYFCSNLQLQSDPNATPPKKPHYYPGVYARVSSQLDWIRKNSDAGQCQN